MALGHDGHALIHGVLLTHEENRAGHDLLDRRFFGEMAHQDSFAGVVTLGQDADQSIVGENQQGTHIVLPIFSIAS